MSSVKENSAIPTTRERAELMIPFQMFDFKLLVTVNMITKTRAAVVKAISCH
ncbi:MAG TPA: hypothetical protein GX523_18115 [Desulfitobacterium dehalogenans]|uniref:Uncharacterized protein n=1 Tax=Desulfitobacterium dehalogenans TaxID=36854 RepID=A0A7C7DC50_9FIRM|nr:hypothetical protein [Desulfitobacterium dehalogenans]